MKMLWLDPFVSPKTEPMEIFQKIYNYFSEDDSNFTIGIPDGYDWEKEKLVQVIETVCNMLNIDYNKVVVLSDSAYTSQNIKFVANGVNISLEQFANGMKDQFIEKKLEKYFLSMTSRPSWDRLCIASFLHHHYNDISKIKFALDMNYLTDNLGIDEAFRKYYRIPQRIKPILDFMLHAPVDNVGEKWTREQLANVKDSDCQFYSHDLYKTIGVEIVNETNTTKGFFLTEKTVRPIAYCTPFVMMASKHHLKHLKTLGFKTFSDVWDESYDDYEDKDRMERIYKTISDISRFTLEELYHRTHEICNYNKSLLDSFAWKNKIPNIKV